MAFWNLNAFLKLPDGWMRVQITVKRVGASKMDIYRFYLELHQHVHMCFGKACSIDCQLGLSKATFMKSLAQSSFWIQGLSDGQWTNRFMVKNRRISSFDSRFLTFLPENGVWPMLEAVNSPVLHLAERLRGLQISKLSIVSGLDRSESLAHFCHSWTLFYGSENLTRFRQNFEKCVKRA